VPLALPDHPLLELAAFVSELPAPVGDLATTADIAALRHAGAAAPLAADDTVRTAVRDLLRAGGFKPSGRSKPASEYLAAAAAQGAFPVINAAVDACNVVSLHSGLPISLVDVDRLAGCIDAASVAVAPVGTRYVFNPAGQEIDVGGLLCLHDAAGPSGSPVKDSQRTKTDATTRTTLSILWGTRALSGRASAASRWYQSLVAGLGGRVTVLVP
jgi:DNA/RNA-binding domain of Phe-tRNA-synthetase-like protein